MRQAVSVAILVAAPMLVTALVIGVLVSFVQAITQIQEQTLTFVPKFAAVAIVLLVALPWVMQEMVKYLVDTLQSLPTIIGS